MASVWRHPKSPFWAACFSVHTPTDVQRWKRSLRTNDRKLARRVAESLEEAGRAALDEKAIALACEQIKDTRARLAASDIFADVFYSVHGREIGAGSLRAFVETWLADIRGELAPQSLLRYKRVAEELIEFLGPTADRDLMSFGARDDVLILQFRDHLGKRVSVASVNTALKIVRQIFKTAAQRFKIESPARMVGGLKPKKSEQGVRRAFTLPEIGRILREVKGSEWEGLIIAGLYTGQRLADLATLRWENVDLVRREISLTTRKTDRRVIVPLAKPLADYLLKLPAGDDGTAPVFPNAAGHVQRAKAEQAGTLSNQFHEILARTGLVRRRTHERQNHGKGRNARRKCSEISFHSFRHTATSLLKNAGVPQSVVMDIVGHESKAISQVYTHVGDEEKRKAVSTFPSITQLLNASRS